MGIRQCTATSRNQAESCNGSSAMEISTSGASAKLRESNRTDKRIDLTMLVPWPAQNFGRAKTFDFLGNQQYFVSDTASQSIRFLDMLKIWEHDPLAPQSYAYVQCNYFTRVERHFRSKNIWLGENWLPFSRSVTTSARLHKRATHTSA